MGSPNLDRLVDTAIFAAQKAGDFLSDNFGQAVKTDRKSSRIDLVTEFDRQSEAQIKEIIQDRFPDHDILAEESPPSKKSSPYKWIVDPLDGTTNFAHGYPVFSVSMGLEYHHQIILGVVYNPVTKELFQATQDKKATLNGGEIRVSKTGELKKSLLATGFPYDIDKMDENLEFFGKFSHKVQGIRRAGSAALDLCNVACGRLDGFWEFDLKPWDLAAGSLVVEGAGGHLSNFSGGDFNIYKGEILATNGRIHESMIDVLKE